MDRTKTEQEFLDYCIKKSKGKLPIAIDLLELITDFIEVDRQKQLLIQRVSCSFADKEILSNSLRFALTETPQDEQGALKDFKKYQALMRKCMLWLKDNYEPPCDGFMNECEA